LKSKLLLVVALVLILGLSSVSVAAGQTIFSNDVNETEAREAALYQIERSKLRMPGWNKAALGDLVTYYAPDNTKSAYEFTVINDDKEVGFVLVSARKDWMPVLEHSSGEAPSKHLSKAVEHAIAKGYASQDDASQTRLIYWGALSYSVQLGEQLKEEGTVIHLPTTRIIPMPEMVELQMEEERAKAAWARHSESIGSTISEALSSIFSEKPAMAAMVNREPIITYMPQTIDWVELDGVPLWYQHSSSCACCDEYSGGADDYPDCAGTADDPWDDWDGCSCIAGAMIVGYDYYGVSEDDETLIDDCHNYMNTNDEGETNPIYFSGGIEDVFDLYNVSCDATNDYLVSWNDIKGEIDAERPFMLSFSGHSQTGVGYEFDTEDEDYRKIWIHTTWYSPRTDVIDFGNWSAACMTKVEVD